MKTRTKKRPQAATRRPTKKAGKKSGKSRKALYTLKQERSPGYRALSFPEVKGKKTEKVELVTSADYHAVTVEFEDKTAVAFEIQPGFIIQAHLRRPRIRQRPGQDVDGDQEREKHLAISNQQLAKPTPNLRVSVSSGGCLRGGCSLSHCRHRGSP